jgi:uroporphyrinogen-III synthase
VDERRANALAGKRVVVTRAVEQSEALVQALKEQGAVPVLAPMVAFAPPDEPGLVDEAIREMGQYDWVLLTSQNAVRALQERCAALGIMLGPNMRNVRIAAVGVGTAEAAEHAGLNVHYVATRHQGTAMAEELKERIKEKKVLLPRSDRANPDLVTKLEEVGAKVKEVVAYKTLRPDEGTLERMERLLRGGADAVLFFSPSAVHHLRQTLGDSGFVELSKRAVFTAIGPVTQEALRKAKIERVLTARDATVGAVVTALVEYFSAGGAKLPIGAKPA